jgi:PEP-CTERM motif-containing protein
MFAMRKPALAAIAFCCSTMLGASVHASTLTTFTGADNGAAIGSGYTNSNAAQASFLTAAGLLGTVDTHGVGMQTLGAASGTWLNGDGTWATNIPPSSCSNGLACVSNVTLGNTFGFNVSSADGNGKFLAFSGDGQAIDFANTVPTHSFGFFATGLQGNDISISFNDGSAETLTVVGNTNGGPQYFGFTDTAAFNAITLLGPAGSDAWGIDQISFNVTGVTSPVPEPSTWAMMILGFAGVGFMTYRRKVKPTFLAV